MTQREREQVERELSIVTSRALAAGFLIGAVFAAAIRAIHALYQVLG